MKSLFIFLLLLSSVTCFSQSALKAYEFPDHVPDAYIVNPYTEYNKLLQSNLKGLKKDEAERFAEEMSYRKSYEFISGRIYVGWDDAEEYLNEVLKKLIPEKERGNTKIHVYLKRSSEYNASAIHDGTLFFNIALLAEVDNEAALACILGHELSHYLNKDVLKTFVQRQKLEVRRTRDKENKKLKELNAYYSRSQERTADSLGAVLAAKAGYDIQYGAGNFYKFLQKEKLEDQAEKKGKIVFAAKDEDRINRDSIRTTQQKMLAFHPENLARINYFKNFIRDYNSKTAKDNIVSKTGQFASLQEKSRLESLNILLEEQDYRECVQRAFTYYLLDPSGETYVYFILESLRRQFLSEPGFSDKLFLSENLKAGLLGKGEGILHNLNILLLDSVAFKSIRATKLADDNEIEFETYEEAFNYFADLAIEKKYHECLFSIALRNSDTIPLRDEYLREYLSVPGGKYELFAKNLLSNSLLSSLEHNNEKLVLLDDIVFLEDHSYGYHNRFILAEQRSPDYIAALNKMMKRKFPDKELHVFSEFSKEHISRAIQYKNLLSLSATMKLLFDRQNNMEDIYYGPKSGESMITLLFALSPDLWYTMHNENLRSVEWISTVAFTDKAKLNLRLIFLPFYMLPNQSFNDFAGSTRFAYSVDYYAFNPFSASDIIIAKEENVNYKMSKPNYLNTVYHVLKLTEK